MEDKITSYEYDYPDFGPDDDTEDMTGVVIYDPSTGHQDKDKIIDKLDNHKTDNT